MSANVCVSLKSLLGKRVTKQMAELSSESIVAHMYRVLCKVDGKLEELLAGLCMCGIQFGASIKLRSITLCFFCCGKKARVV